MKKKRDFVVPDIKVRKMTKLSTPSFFSNTENTKLPVVIFQLRENKTILQKIKRPIFKMQIKTLYKDKPPKAEPFKFSPLIAVFKLPQNYKQRNLEIIALDPFGKEIYSAPVPKKPKSEPKENIVYLIEKNTRR